MKKVKRMQERERERESNGKEESQRIRGQEKDEVLEVKETEEV